MKAVYPGSFDPITIGHLDVLERAIPLFDVIVAVATHSPKTMLFSVEERMAMVEEAIRDHFKAEDRSRLMVDHFDGLLVDHLKKTGRYVILRGLRAVSDYEYELQLAHMNRRLMPSAETVFLVASPQYSFLSSTLVKEVIRLGGDVSSMVPKSVEERLKAKITER
ncbi:MAG: pantetheine-phosphate adenylyltransferase [bacterium]